MNNRRKLLLALSGASAVTVWTKPVVDAVMIPAHGATTCGELVLYSDDIEEHVIALNTCFETWEQDCDIWISCMAESCIEATFQDCV